ncbi:MAG: GNAT family N-acetyltransferase [Burkholderiales bacterium]|nr:GNAT family N-acetyltransferase [Burkholderiales bacterium]
MNDAGTLVEHALDASHLAGCVALVAEANWNQNAADWRLMLTLGRGFGMSDAAGRLVATALALPFEGRFGWISMVLVTADYRRRGLATRLMQRAIDALLAAGCVPLLDATPAGREVYRRVGFEDCWSLERLQLCADRGPAPPPAAPGATVRRIAPGDWPALLAYDADVFGARREAILTDLARRVPQAALLAERGGRLCGALLARDGRVATQIGPVVADDAATALALLVAALGAIRPPVFIDVSDRHATIGAWLRAGGFVLQRPYTRMAYRRSRAFDDPARLFAIAGPELG